MSRSGALSVVYMTPNPHHVIVVAWLRFCILSQLVFPDTSLSVSANQTTTVRKARIHSSVSKLFTTLDHTLERHYNRSQMCAKCLSKVSRTCQSLGYHPAHQPYVTTNFLQRHCHCRPLTAGTHHWSMYVFRTTSAHAWKNPVSSMG